MGTSSLVGWMLHWWDSKVPITAKISSNTRNTHTELVKTSPAPTEQAMLVMIQFNSLTISSRASKYLNSSNLWVFSFVFHFIPSFECLYPRSTMSRHFVHRSPAFEMHTLSMNQKHNLSLLNIIKGSIVLWIHSNVSTRPSTWTVRSQHVTNTKHVTIIIIERNKRHLCVVYSYIHETY